MADTKHIGIVCFDDMEELDAVGPWEVLSFWTSAFPDDGWAVTTMSVDGRPVRCAKGMVITPQVSYADAPVLDIVVYPGGQGTREHTEDAERLDWVRAQAARGALMTSVCTGSLVYAAAGLLAGRPATTHWGVMSELTRLDPTIVVDTDARYVDDGDVITSAGVSAGIDMALYLVGRLVSPERSQIVRSGIQYDPAPPY